MAKKTVTAVFVKNLDLKGFCQFTLMADKARADALEARAEQLLAEFVPQADRVYQTVSNE